MPASALPTARARPLAHKGSSSVAGRTTIAAVVALTVLAGILRFSTLDVQSLWSDEAMTAVLARMGFHHMLHTISATESTPPVYYVLVWVWAKAFGHGEVGLRSLSALAGTMTVPAAYIGGSTLVGRRGGVAAAAIVAVSPPLVWYSQEARAYALVICLCAVSFAAFARALRDPTSVVVAIWTLTSALAVGTHYFAIFPVGAEVAWSIAVSRRRRVLVGSAVVVAAAGALVPLALKQRGNGLAEHIGTAGGGLANRVVVLSKQFLVGASLPADRAFAAVAGLLIVASLGYLVVRATRSEQRGVVLAATVGVAPIVVPVALALAGLDYVNTRNGLAGFVPLAVAATAGLALARRRVAVLALGTLVAVSLAITLVVAADSAYQRPDWRGFARALGRPDVARAVVVTPDHEGWFARVPLQIYVPDARAVDEGLVPPSPQFASVSRRPVDRATPARLAVREVVLAGIGWATPTPPRPLPPTFTVVERRAAAGYQLVRYRSRQPVLLSTKSLAAPLSVVLVERPGR